MTVHLFHDRVLLQRLDGQVQTVHGLRHLCQGVVRGTISRCCSSNAAKASVIVDSICWIFSNAWLSSSAFSRTWSLGAEFDGFGKVLEVVRTHRDLWFVGKALLYRDEFPQGREDHEQEESLHREA